MKNKISNTTNWATATALTAVSDHWKYFTAPWFYKLKKENFSARLAQGNLSSKNNIANFVKTLILWSIKKFKSKTLIQRKQNMDLFKMD